MKITKSQLKQIIKEEKAKLFEMNAGADITPSQAEIEDALLLCFCDWSSDGSTARMTFNQFMLEVAEKLGVPPESLARSCELIRVNAGRM